jgi:hypothetical protein
MQESPDRQAARAALLRWLAERIVADWLKAAENQPKTIITESDHACSHLRSLQHRPPAGNLD